MTLATLLLVAISVLVVSALPSWGYRDVRTCYSLEIFQIGLLGPGILLVLILMG